MANFSYIFCNCAIMQKYFGGPPSHINEYPLSESYANFDAFIRSVNVTLKITAKPPDYQ